MTSELSPSFTIWFEGPTFHGKWCVRPGSRPTRTGV